jgi:DNA polymerase-1
VQAFIATTIEQATEDGYVSTLMGRRRQIPELRARNRQVRQLGERLAVNTVIQGTAADVIKVAMVRVDRVLHDAGLATRLVLQIHDELLFEGPQEELERARDLVMPEMVGALELDPPLVVDAGIGPNWLEAK